MNELNPRSLDTVCAALAQLLGAEKPEKAADPAPELLSLAEKAFGGARADRIFMYNPDAVAEWVYRKYPFQLKYTKAASDLELPLCTVMPSVTPVCFGTLYTGAQPKVHGITRYEKPVIAIDTLFDALIRAGKKPAIVADSECSMGKIFLNRSMDYYIFDSLPEINACAARLILEDRYDFIAVYNGNYDSVMHRYGPESSEALGELSANDEAYAQFMELIRTHWTAHNTLTGFAMDHGCHEIDGHCGSHGLDMPEDLNICHLYRVIPRRQA